MRMIIFKYSQTLFSSMGEDEIDLLESDKCKIRMRKDGTAVLDCKGNLGAQELGMIKKVSNIAIEQQTKKKIRDPE